MHESPALEFPSIPVWTWLVVALLALVVFAVGFDQGQLLQPLLGKAAVTGNYLHELFHDGRHFMAVPCH
ncbi:MAG TPA: CbtB-domain containing protein [Actinomycetota bacterium]|nr:CbtB-domain containing protein [Actinomycetota bacterium]